jgi:hypothetical protein
VLTILIFPLPGDLCRQWLICFIRLNSRQLDNGEGSTTVLTDAFLVFFLLCAGCITKGTKQHKGAQWFSITKAGLTRISPINITAILATEVIQG